MLPFFPQPVWLTVDFDEDNPEYSILKARIASRMKQVAFALSATSNAVTSYKAHHLLMFAGGGRPEGHRSCRYHSNCREADLRRKSYA